MNAMDRAPSSPLARALYWKREAWLQLEIFEGLGRDPSYERDVAFDAWAEADALWRKIIREEWQLRWMERYQPISFRPITQEQAREAL